MTTEPVQTDAEVLPPEFFTAPDRDHHTQNAALRGSCPMRAINYPPGADAFVVADYETTLKTFTDPRLSKQVENSPAWFRDQLKESSPVLIRNMITADAPDHTRLRKLVSQAFLPRRMERLRPRIQEITDSLIDGFPDSGEVDLIEFAFSVPMRVICEFLRVRIEDRPQLHEWGNLLSGAPYPDEETNRRLKWASESIERYLLDLLEERRADLGDDLVSELIRAADEEDRFSNDELVSTMVLLIIAGHKTTANLIGNGTQALLRHPDQLQWLIEHPEQVELAVEELLRYESPVYRGTLRVATEEFAIHGQEVNPEAFVHLLITSANRDADAFPEPDRLDLQRTPNRHLSFGHGAHFCAGAPLSRVEGQVVFNTLLRRLPGLRLAVPAEDLEWIFDNSTSRGLASLPVRYDERRPG
jgi:cytochrome P450